jgi:hypothetical protein
MSDSSLRRVLSVTLLMSVLVFNITPMFVASAQEKQKSKLNMKFFKADFAKLVSLDYSKTIWRIDIQTPEDKARIKRVATVIEDYGTFVIAATARNNFLDGFEQKIRLETTINLPGSKFEPLSDTIHSVAESANGEEDYYIVQFVAPARDKWFEDLKGIGAEFIQYTPHNAFFVYANSEQISQISNYYRVRWVGRYLPEDKISSVLRAQLEHARGQKAIPENISPIEVNDGRVKINVAVFARADLAKVTLQIRDIASAIIEQIERLPNNYFNLVRVEVPLGEVEKIATLKDVFTIEGYIRPLPEDERAAHIVAGNYNSQTQLFPPGYNPLVQFGVTGQNVTVAVSDDGVSIPGNGGYYITSSNTRDALCGTATAGASSGHGHLCASIIAGTTPYGPLDPLGYNYGLGVAPGANIINIPFLKSGYTCGDGQAVNDAVVTTGVNGVRGTISNNSWGAGTNGNSYDSLAAQYDGYVRDASFAPTIDPLLIVFSAGNSGTSGLTRPKVAKNIIAVASSENIRTELSSSADNIDDLSSFSSRGPAADGRVKPDITAPGTAITGGRAGTGLSPIDSFHSWGSGTSFAAPQVAGAAALFTEFWKSRNFGLNPSPALVKAALINGTVDMNGIDTTAPIPNGAEGWGRVNLKNVLNTGVPIKYIDQTVEFTDVGQSLVINGTVANSTRPFRVSLVWTDPPGTTNPALVNDLDLTVTIGGQTYRGNVFSGGVSTTGGTANNRDNVENVFLPSGIPTGTPFTVRISATALNGDGILGNSDSTDQHFSLVIYNAVTRPEIADFDGDGRTDLSVYRSSNNAWYLQRSTAGFTTVFWGTSGDILAPADYDGDGKADVAIYRGNNTPGSFDYFILRSSTNTLMSVEWGASGDIPVPGDYDGDGKADYALYRPSDQFWYILKGSDFTILSMTKFGQAGDIPVAGDFDGDGKSDLTVFRNGTWITRRSSDGNVVFVNWGLSTDLPVPADYDNDNKDDIAVFRPSNGFWYILRSGNGQGQFVQFGASGDVPVPGDYDGDGADDIAVYRGGIWYVNRSTSGLLVSSFGISTDTPLPKTYIP